MIFTSLIVDIHHHYLQTLKHIFSASEFLWARFEKCLQKFTDTEIGPSGGSDDFLHAGPVCCCEREAEEEAEDVVEVVAEVQQHGEEAEASVREGRPQENLNQSDQNTRN